MLKIIWVTLLLMIFSQAWGQKRCMQFCFDVTKKGTSIANDTIRKTDMDSLGFTVTFFNCGDKDFQAPPIPYVANGYAYKSAYNNLGKSCFHIALFKCHINYFPYFISDNYLPQTKALSSDNKKMVIVHPHKEVVVKDFYWTDYLKNLPPGKYEIALDYADEFKETKLPKNDSIIAKYYKTDQPISSGAYMQFSKNTIRFTVVE